MEYCGVFRSSLSHHSCIGYEGRTPYGSTTSQFVGGTATTYVTPQVFAEMPTPSSWHEANVISPGHWNYGYVHQTPIQSSHLQSGSTNSIEQYLDGMPQPYDFHNLNRQSLFLADGTQRSYYVLPENYSFKGATSSASPAMPTTEVCKSCQSFTPPRNDQISEKETHPGSETQSIGDMLAQIQSKLQTMSENLKQDLKRMKSPESKQTAESQTNPSTQETINVPNEMPLYDVYAEEDKNCSIGSCNVLDANLVIQGDGEGKPGTERTSKYFSKALENVIPFKQPPMSTTAADQMQFQASESMPNYDVCEKEDSACLDIISHARDFTLELQQQDDESACSCPVLKASDSLITKSSQISVDHSMSKLRLLWDPGASASLHSNKSKPPEELSYVAVVFPEVPTLCNKVGTYAQQLRDSRWNVLLSHERRKEWDPGDTKLFTSAAGATNSQCIDAYKSPMVHMLDVQFGATRTNSPCATVVWSCWFPSFEMTKLQWDPGIGTPPSIYPWLQGLTARIATRKLSLLQISELPTWRSKLTSASYAWDPGTMLLGYRSIWLLLFTEEKEMTRLILEQWSLRFKDMHYCKIFQRCTPMNSLFYCHGIPLWLMNFQVP